MPAASFQSRWLPAIAWACLIFALSGVPSLGTDLGLWDTVLRKLAHATEYAILAVLLTRAAAPAAWLGGSPSPSRTSSTRRSCRGEPARPLDVAIDAARAPVGLLVLRRSAASIAAWTGRTCPTGSSRPCSSASTGSPSSSRLNRRQEAEEGLLRVVAELRSLNESLQALAYAALGQSGPTVRRRRAG